MIEKIEYKGELYPKFQSEGFAAEFIIPFAKKVCKGIGVDVGCNRIEWMFGGEYANKENVQDFSKWLEDVTSSSLVSNSFPIDPIINGFNSTNFPEGCLNLDYIFSSHCLEHIGDWVTTLDYWTQKLKDSGTLFLYLPHYSQVYWRPWNNRKHLNVFTPEIICDYLRDRGYKWIHHSEKDLNHSFAVIAEK